MLTRQSKSESERERERERESEPAIETPATSPPLPLDHFLYNQNFLSLTLSPHG
jgi:hypothetical protein